VVAGVRRFVVHLHAATRLHYDLRLEIACALASWALPKAPSLDPEDKRLAVHVEDHPLTYGDFEGVIPEGNYGAGATIVWDRGRLELEDDPEAGLRAGKLLFTLHGHKLKGLWTLVRTGGKKAAGKDWLLIKKPDGHARVGATLPAVSVLSGLSVDDRARPLEVARGLAEQARAAGARPGDVDVMTLAPMLAETADAPFSRPGWAFEIKYDGYRLLAAGGPTGARLRYRGGGDATSLFPELTLALATLPARCVLDGEVVVADATGRPRFQALQERARLRAAGEVERAAWSAPATLFVFDLLAVEGLDTRALPLSTRKALLAGLVPALGPVQRSEHVETRGEDFYAAAVGLGLEGVVAKRLDAPYRGRRDRAWLKVRAQRTGDFVIVGTHRSAGRAGAGALWLAAHDGPTLRCCGRVGSGLGERDVEEALAFVGGETLAEPPCAGVEAGRGDRWLPPHLACEVRYTEWTRDGGLRHPVFLRLRPDKPVADCVLPADAQPSRGEAALPADAAEEREPPPPAPAQEAPREVGFTNLTKVFWPAEGYTKGDLVEYYRSVCPFLLPYLRDRPLVLTRFPDGIGGKSFFQKDAPRFAPAWIRRERIFSESSRRDIDYFLVDDEAALLWLVNLGTIPLHLWASRVGSLERPDWIVLDFDPKGAPFAHVVTLARAARALCDELGLPSHPKTSGQSGLHVLVPLGRQCTFEHARLLAELLAGELVRRHPDIATVARALGARRGRVYVDFGQNGHGQLLVAPLSARPVPGGTVSMPLAWTEVGAKLDPAAFTLRSAPRRLARRGDPLAPVLTEVPDLVSALERLARIVPG
jgi:bifunctional non-homologous end joining protein LigD